MSIIQFWAGRAYGTNTGNLFVMLEGEDSALTGSLHLNDDVAGIVIYSIQGKFENFHLSLVGIPTPQRGGTDPGQLTINAALQHDGIIRGGWTTSTGFAGTLVLFPQNQTQPVKNETDQVPPQLHTARYDFGAVVVDREKIISIADAIQQNFNTNKIVVTFIKGNQQSQFLPDFKKQNFNSDLTTFIRLSAREPENDVITRVIQVEFGPQVNFVKTEGGNQSWVLGTLENLKNYIRPLERGYTTKLKKYGFIILTLLTPIAIVVFPSIKSLWNRAILMTAILAITGIIIWLHNRYLPPNATIYLGQKPEGAHTNIIRNIFSLGGAVIATVIAGIILFFLTDFLQG